MKKIILLLCFVFLLPTAIAYGGWNQGGWNQGGWNFGTSEPPSAPSAPSGFTSGAEAGTVILASETASMNKELCELSSDFAWLVEEDTCYECSGWVESEGDDVVCNTCNEGYVMSNNQCVSTVQKTITNMFDRFVNMFFKNNAIAGLVVIVSVLVVGFIVFNNKEEIIERVRHPKTFRKRISMDDSSEIQYIDEGKKAKESWSNKSGGIQYINKAKKVKEKWSNKSGEIQYIDEGKKAKERWLKK